jgi:hypothetical protein
MINGSNVQKCPSEESILDYHYGELSQKQSIDVRVHVEQCDTCLIILNQYAAMSDAFSEVRGEINSAPVAISEIPKLRWTERLFGRFTALSWKPVLTSSFAVIAISSILIFTFSEGGDRNASSPGTNPGGQIASSQEIIRDGNGQSDDSMEENDLASVPIASVAYGGLRLADFDPEPTEGIRLADILNEVE